MVDAFFFCVGGSVGKYAHPAHPLGLAGEVIGPVERDPVGQAASLHANNKWIS